MQRGADEERRQRPDPVGDPTKREPADYPRAKHQGQHPRAVRATVAEVDAVGDDVDLGHRHRGAAGHPGQHQQHLQPVRRDPGGQGWSCGRQRPRSSLAGSGRPSPQGQEKRQHCRDTEDADAEISLPPSGGLGERLDDERPGCAGEIAAAGADRDSHAAPPLEPQGDIGDHRAETGGTPDADQQAMRERELPDFGGLARGGKAEPQHDRPDRDRQGDAEPVGKPAHGRAADDEPQHDRGIGQRGSFPVDPELRLDGRKHDGDRPQADAADRTEQHRREQANPRIGALGVAHRAGIGRPRGRCVHEEGSQTWFARWPYSG